MKDLLEYIIKAIVAEPDAVNITEENSDEGLLIKLEVAPDDKGRVIGRQGRVAQALRTLVNSQGFLIPS
jgi:predicted RNA-binding protein YlqC (UPF0109 family)